MRHSCRSLSLRVAQCHSEHLLSPPRIALFVACVRRPVQDAKHLAALDALKSLNISVEGISGSLSQPQPQQPQGAAPSEGAGELPGQRTAPAPLPFWHAFVRKGQACTI